jgi:RecG-like helicase
MRFAKRSARRGAASRSGSPDHAVALVGDVPGCEPIGGIRPRHRCRVAGIVESIKLVPRPDTMRLEITISDGTGEISGVWFGRPKIGGLDLGERVAFEGMIGSPGAGKLEILHPTYQLLGPA